jgi:glycosyltransferase involved in cell wall biosynthesis
MKIVADLYKSGEVQGGVQSKNDVFKAIDPKFGVFSYFDACTALNYPLVSIDLLRFREWEANYILQKFVDMVEKSVPGELDLIVYNALCGGYMKHKAKTISVLNDNYIEMSDRLYAGTYVDLNAYNMYRRMYLKLQLDSCRNADLVAAESETDAGMYKKYGVEATVVENGVDSNFWTALPDKDALRDKYNIPKDKRVGIFVGAFSPIKGYHIAHNLMMRRKDLHWIMVLKHPLNQSVRSEHISVASNVNHETLRELYSVSDFFFLPSIWESGHSISSLEAMSCNLPLLVSAVGGYYNRGGNNDFGVVVKDWTVDGFNKGLEGLLFFKDNYKPRDALFKNGWDFESYKKRWEKVLQV